MIARSCFVERSGTTEMTETMSLAGTRLEVVERGQGRPLLFLHAGEGLAPERPWLELLSHRFRVVAPWHPGYGNSPLIDGSGSVDDLAYLYLELATELGFENAILVGACAGGVRVVAVAEYGDINHMRWCGILPNLAVDALQIDPLVEPAADPFTAADFNEVKKPPSYALSGQVQSTYRRRIPPTLL